MVITDARFFTFTGISFRNKKVFELQDEVQQVLLGELEIAGIPWVAAYQNTRKKQLLSQVNAVGVLQFLDPERIIAFERFEDRFDVVASFSISPEDALSIHTTCSLPSVLSQFVYATSCPLPRGAFVSGWSILSSRGMAVFVKCVTGLFGKYARQPTIRASELYRRHLITRRVFDTPILHM